MNLEMRVLVIGDFLLDEYLFVSTNQFKLFLKSRKYALGGAANLAALIKNENIKIEVLAMTIFNKQTDTGKLVLMLCQNSLINTAHVINDDNMCVSRKLRIYEDTQLLIRVNDDCKNITTSELIEIFLKKLKNIIKCVDILVISDYCKGLLNDIMIKNIIAICRKVNVPVFVDSKKSDGSLFRNAYLLKVNEREMLNLVSYYNINGKNIVSIAKSLYDKLNIEHLIITLANEGLILVNVDRTCTITCKKQLEENCVGAGDYLLSQLCIGYLNSLDIISNVHRASDKTLTYLQKGRVLTEMSEIYKHEKNKQKNCH